MHRCHTNSTISRSCTQILHKVKAKQMNVNPKSHRIEINGSDKKTILPSGMPVSLHENCPR